ncbi:bacillithiol biosynthesis BshC [Candidatus Bipolaricaulota bacterium]|nr:bacillithiol biosynthesis BshC [Candidatus Bipolaricaulota bacterium]
MTQFIDPRILYSQSPFFLDYIDGKNSTPEFFQHSATSIHRLAETRQAIPSQQTRSEGCDALLEYNQVLNASSRTTRNIEHLRDSKALCVIGGQQAGFLGGPLFVIYKIASIIRTAARLSDRLDVPVLPVFWLASEDHDFAEINHTRWLDDSGALRTISFDWEGHGQPIEHLPITEAVRDAFVEVRQKIPFSNAIDAAIFSPTDEDIYCTWHARIWSRLFADYGLILVEPRVLRSLAEPFFRRALTERREIQAGLALNASRLMKLGYPVPLDPSRSGGLFEIGEDGIRQRIDDSSIKMDLQNSVQFSADAILRPVLADSLLPTLANILGPSELAYHAMLRPLYERWDIPQPLALPRQGATLIPKASFDLLNSMGIEISETLHPGFKPAEVVKRLASEELSLEFSEARARMEKALLPLKDPLIQLDPGLETRWRQTVDQARHQVQRLEDRAIRADLARQGISVKNIQNLKPLLFPMEKPQERILSAFSFIAKYGVEWIHEMIAHSEPFRFGGRDWFEHQLIVLEESHE